MTDQQVPGSPVGGDRPPLEAEYLWIDSAEALESFAASLPAPGGLIGMDLEADNMHCYQEKLCLLQVDGGEGAVGLIDPLVIDDLSPLTKRLFDPAGEIWMHGADFDISLMSAAFGEVPPMIWDTQIAAQLCGFRRFGLAAVTEEILGFTMSKGSQKEDWSKRPLTQKMLDYAALDARLMFPLSEFFKKRLVELGRWDWFEESCVAARENVLNRAPRDPDTVWRVNGWGKVPKGRAQAYLRELWHWRDREAERRDRPHFKVVNNRDLVQLATKLGSSSKPSRKDLRWRLSKKALAEFGDVVEKVEAMAASDYPQRPAVQRLAKDDAFDDRVNALIAKRNAVAAEHDLEPSLIAPRKTIELLALHSDPIAAFDPANESPGRPRPMMLNWQRQLLGLI
ncbi:ribonuclease D [Sulfuriroseicoccus oceanibius]|uniref:HRDC domain-containing protein n=1 Tax=Sulfuriroseicoccus oceanibius TaxID=2707525 RepID=A0A6B3L588_9BACT|nr:ribonuclease D [Sulfuriroseicoccus oceanibius]QQL44511.1 HRDC domain-containing protein [Sulfuriroseicoccus oceanibius]